MVLSLDCIRDVLLTVESLDFGQCLTLDQLNEKLPMYKEEQLHYTCLKLYDGGFLQLMTIPIQCSVMPGIKQITDLTFAGHEFLNSIREDKNWDKIKSIAKAAGAYSLESILQITKDVISQAIKSAIAAHL